MNVNVNDTHNCNPVSVSDSVKPNQNQPTINLCAEASYKPQKFNMTVNTMHQQEPENTTVININSAQCITGQPAIVPYPSTDNFIQKGQETFFNATAI